MEQTIDLGNSTKCYKVTCFPKIENWHVAEGTMYRFHSIHMTILFYLPTVLITFVFANSLIKTYFEDKVIKSDWKLKTMLFLRIFWFYVQTMPSYHNSTAFYKNLTGIDLGCSSDEEE